MAEISTVPVPPGYFGPISVGQTYAPPTVVFNPMEMLKGMMPKKMAPAPFRPGEFCFGFDRSICENLPVYKSGDVTLDTRSLCSGITNFLCIFLVVATLVVVLGVAVYGLIVE